MVSQRARRAVFWFVLLTFGFTWLLWGVLWLPGAADNRAFASLVPAVGMWIPGITALLLTRVYLRESLRTTTLDRLGPRRYYLWAWFLPIVGTLASTALTVGVGLARFDPDFTQTRSMMEASGKQPPVPMPIIIAAMIALSLTLAPLFNVLFALGEEIGWRGFLLPRLLQAGVHQWAALILSGAIWGLWHAPLIIRGQNYPGHPYLGVVLMTVFCSLLGVIFGWLRLASSSVWAPALAHGSLNAVAGIPILVLTPFDMALGGMLTSLVGWLLQVAFIGWLVWSGRLPVRLEEPSPTCTPLLVPASTH
jgi:membrane protease YdiL (CAAX protease family)